MGCEHLTCSLPMTSERYRAQAALETSVDIVPNVKHKSCMKTNIVLQSLYTQFQSSLPKGNCEYHVESLC
jgi:hypothetical protein